MCLQIGLHGLLLVTLNSLMIYILVFCLQKSFDFGPSLLDEMDAVFRSFGGSPVPPPPPSPGLPPPPASPLDETINVRNELREMAAKVTGKKKQATVS
jgi:hypothetical protein